VIAVRYPRGRALRLALLAACALGAHARANESPVATLDQDRVTAQELDSRTAEKLGAQQKEYDKRAVQLRLAFERSQASYRERQLNKLVDEHVLALEADARRTSPEALLEAQRAAPVTEAQVRSFYDQKSAQINQSYAAAAPKIREFLAQSASEEPRRRFLDSLRAKYHAAILLEPRREAVTATGPVRGPDTAPVTIVEFSDFQCPFCGRFEPVLERVIAGYPGQVRLIYRNFPLAELHPQAQKAAEAAMCADAQGKFWEMHDLMFAEQKSLGSEDLEDKAQRLGLDAEKFAQCLDSGQMRSAVEVDVEDGEALGIQGTPAHFINGRFLSGAVEEGELTAIIDDELRRAHRIARR
jgi:protein-disulfide isomerase